MRWFATAILDVPWHRDAGAHEFVEQHPAGATYGEIARELGITDDAVKEIGRSALRKLQRSEGAPVRFDSGERVVPLRIGAGSYDTTLDYEEHARGYHAQENSPFTQRMFDSLRPIEDTAYYLDRLLKACAE